MVMCGWHTNCSISVWLGCYTRAMHVRTMHARDQPAHESIAVVPLPPDDLRHNHRDCTHHTRQFSFQLNAYAAHRSLASDVSFLRDDKERE